jgi:hypothetical protein
MLENSLLMTFLASSYGAKERKELVTTYNQSLASSALAFINHQMKAIKN